MRHFEERALTLVKEDLEERLGQGNILGAQETLRRYEESRLELVRRELRPGHTLTELLDLRGRLPARKWAVEGLLPAGFTLFGGKYKFGKSHLMRQLCLDIVTGDRFMGHFPDQGPHECLYLDFEQTTDLALEKYDEIIRAQGLGDLYHHWGHRLHIRTEGSWPPMHQGGLEMMEDFHDEHPDLVLVVIDVWVNFRPPRKGNDAFNYEMDYRDVRKVKRLADERGFAVVALHHVKKSLRAGETSPEAVFDALYGGTGLMAAADNIMALTPSTGRADALLWGKSRIFSHNIKYALGRNDGTKTWSFLGDSERFEMGQTQEAILEVLEEKAPRQMSPKDIAPIVGKTENNVRVQLRQMAVAGKVNQKSYGKYYVEARGRSLGRGGSSLDKINSINCNSVNSINSPESDENKELAELRINGKTPCPPDFRAPLAHKPGIADWDAPEAANRDFEGVTRHYRRRTLESQEGQQNMPETNYRPYGTPAEPGWLERQIDILILQSQQEPGRG